MYNQFLFIIEKLVYWAVIAIISVVQVKVLSIKTLNAVSVTNDRRYKVLSFILYINLK